MAAIQMSWCISSQHLRILLAAVVLGVICHPFHLVNGFLSSKLIVRHKAPSRRGCCNSNGLSMQQTNSNSNTNHDKELFSVAPMMAHTNRHYRFFWRLFSTRTFLYTEMIPAQQIVTLYDRELNQLRSRGRMTLKHNSPPSAINDPNDNDNVNINIDTDEILEVLYQIKQSNYEGKTINSRGNIDSLDELLRISDPVQTNNNIMLEQHPPTTGHTTLQLGGSDPYLLAKASAIGAAFGYDSINLNCGCPSNSVSGRRSGAALMKEPMHVARCVESMNQALTNIYHSSSNNDSNGLLSSTTHGVIPLSVKHRLGVKDAAIYNAKDDRMKSDEEEAFPTCQQFVNAVTFAGDVKKLQVHARLGLLGDFDPLPTTTTTTSTAPTSSSSSSSSIWVPGSTTTTSPSKSIDHKRVQYHAKRKSRKATIQNRSVPPLRPGVIDLLANEFPHLEFVANGGIPSLQAVQDRIVDGHGGVIGAMAGRAAINHPCSFATADSLWDDECDTAGTTTNNNKNDRNEGLPDHNPIPVPSIPSRGDVLLDYIAYCDREESRITSMGNISIGSLAALRRRLVAVPFHLFVGEEGNHPYQRRIRKLVSRAERHSAKAMLMAALNELPAESINKGVGDYASLDDLAVYNFVERSGPLQKNIH